jgi:hypothetical protein
MAVGDLVLAVSIDDVREILQVVRLAPLPHAGFRSRRDEPARRRGACHDSRCGWATSPLLGRRSCIVVVEALAP